MACCGAVGGALYLTTKAAGVSLLLSVGFAQRLVKRICINGC